MDESRTVVHVKCIHVDIATTHSVDEMIDFMAEAMLADTLDDEPHDEHEHEH